MCNHDVVRDFNFFNDKLRIQIIEETRLGKPLWPEEAVHCEHVMGGRSYHGCHEFVHISGTLASTKLSVTLQ
jgi:hypothetical protein